MPGKHLVSDESIILIVKLNNDTPREKKGWGHSEENKGAMNSSVSNK